MSSLGCRYNLSPECIKGYLRTYDNMAYGSPDEWSKAESQHLKIGSLVVFLESANIDPRSHSSQGTQDKTYMEDKTYRVSAMSAVVGIDAGRPIVLRMTDETYELTYLAASMVKPAQEVQFASEPFFYILIEPKQELSEQKLQAIEQLGLSFARGGSRQRKDAQTMQLTDPAFPLFDALGLEITSYSPKQPFDLGAVCYMLFSSGEPTEDDLVNNVRAAFNPVPFKDHESQLPVDLQEPGKGVSKPNQPGKQPPQDSLRTILKSAVQAPQQPPNQESKQDDLMKLLGLGGIFAQEHDQQGVTATAQPSVSPNVKTDQVLPSSPVSPLPPIETPQTDSLDKSPPGQTQEKIPSRRAAVSGNEFKSVVAKLEQQVTKNASRLIEQADLIQHQLDHQLQEVTKEAFKQVDQACAKLAQAKTQYLQDTHQSVEDSQEKMAALVDSGQSSLKQLAEISQSNFDATHCRCHEVLTELIDKAKSSSTNLAQTVCDKLTESFQQNSLKLEDTLQTILNELKGRRQDDLLRLQLRFKQLASHIQLESQSICKSFASHNDSIRGNLENICLRAEEKLKQSATDFIITLKETVNTYKLDLLSTGRSLNCSVLIPNLREHLSQLKSTAYDLRTQFVHETADTTAVQLAELKSNLATMMQELDELIPRLVLDLEQTLPVQELKLTDSGLEASKSIEESITNLRTLFDKAEKQISQNNLKSSQLAEIDSQTTELNLTAEKEASKAYLQKLKDEALGKLTLEIASHISVLEKEGQTAQTALSTSRDKHAQLVAHTADEAVKQIKEAIKEAFQAIQTESSQYLE